MELSDNDYEILRKLRDRDRDGNFYLIYDARIGRLCVLGLIEITNSKYFILTFTGYVLLAAWEAKHDTRFTPVIQSCQRVL